MAITGQMRPHLGFGEALVGDWQEAGLIKASVFKPVFTTIEQSLVIRVMGRASTTVHKRCANCWRSYSGSQPGTAVFGQLWVVEKDVARLWRADGVLVA